jgi:hypothetical protein
MKKIILSSLSIIFSFALFAQSSFQIHDHSGNNISGSTIHVWEDSSTVIEASFEVMNMNSTQPFLMAKCKRRLNSSTIPGSANYFCWVACYSPVTNVSPSADTLYYNQAYNKFHGYMNPYNASGDVSVTYTVYDNTNNNDSTWVTIVYHAGAVGIANLAPTGENKLTAAYPNPVASVANLSYTLKSNVQVAKISIYDMLGNLVKEIQLEEKQGTVKMHVDEMQPGIYFYSLVADSKVISTKKMIVSR